jgi:hypothetical protein
MERRLKSGGTDGSLPLLPLLFSPYHGLDNNPQVCDLIDPTTGWWNFQLIHNIFTSEEAASICSVALSLRRSNDILIGQAPQPKFFW